MTTNYVSDALDDYTDLDALDGDGVSRRRVGPELLRCGLRRLLRFERDHPPAGVVIKPDPLRTNETWRLLDARYRLLSQIRSCLIDIVKRGLSEDCVHACLRSLLQRPADPTHRPCP
jgi:hypothetical protein